MILAGGLGTRLNPVWAGLPKALVPAGGIPIIFRLLDQLLEAGIGRVILCTGHLGIELEQVLGSVYRSLQLVYSREPHALGTAGAIRFALHLTEENHVLVLNGDSYTATPLDAFRARALQDPSVAHILLTKLNDCSRYGSVELTSDGRIGSFLEKNEAALAGWVNCGVYSVPRSWVADIPDLENISLEREMFPKWTPRGMKGYTVEAPFIDIGIPETFRAADGFFQGLPRRDLSLGHT